MLTGCRRQQRKQIKLMLNIPKNSIMAMKNWKLQYNLQSDFLSFNDKLRWKGFISHFNLSQIHFFVPFFFIS